MTIIIKKHILVKVILKNKFLIVFWFHKIFCPLPIQSFSDSMALFKSVEKLEKAPSCTFYTNLC